MVLRFFLRVWDFVDLLEIRSSATAQNFRSPQLIRLPYIYYVLIPFDAIQGDNCDLNIISWSFLEHQWD